MTLVFGNVWLTETRNPGRTGKYYVALPIEFHLTSHYHAYSERIFKNRDTVKIIQFLVFALQNFME